MGGRIVGPAVMAQVRVDGRDMPGATVFHYKCWWLGFNQIIICLPSNPRREGFDVFCLDPWHRFFGSQWMGPKTNYFLSPEWLYETGVGHHFKSLDLAYHYSVARQGHVIRLDIANWEVKSIEVSIA